VECYSDCSYHYLLSMIVNTTYKIGMVVNTDTTLSSRWDRNIYYQDCAK
jgi:hypothetical protein